MVEPNFSESQLQQLVNTEITRRLLDLTKQYFPAVVISLPEELLLGWDTAFYFPWLGVPGLKDHRGNNFFIQYKLSQLIEGPRGGEYEFWNESYLRFVIPYHSKNTHWHYDYHQFDSLVALSNKGYDVFYATNQILYDTELFEYASQKRLLDNTPFLRVTRNMQHHIKVTFTINSSDFFLHSEFEKINKENINQILEQRNKKLALTEVIDSLYSHIKKFSKDPKTFDNLYFRYSNYPEDIRIRYQVIIISLYLRRTMNIIWFFIPS